MLYLTLVRSNFEHCSTIWRPVNIVDLRKFEALQKRAIKWINSEEAYRYSDEIYAIRCREANILPLQLHFELNDLVLMIICKNFLIILFCCNSVKEQLMMFNCSFTELQQRV